MYIILEQDRNRLRDLHRELPLVAAGQVVAQDFRGSILTVAPCEGYTALAVPDCIREIQTQVDAGVVGDAREQERLIDFVKI